MIRVPRVLTTVILLAAGLCLRVSASDTLPSLAFVQAAEHGQALLLGRLGECYAVTPAHVIGDSFFATLVAGEAGAPQGDADHLQTFGYDVALLRATGQVARYCGGELTRAPSIDSLLSDTAIANVASVNSDGSISRRQVTLIDVDLLYLRVRPRTPDDQLYKGLSGSLVLAGDSPIGILMSVNPETGEGRVLRYDRTIETLRPFFGLNAAVRGRDTDTEPAAASPSGSVLGEVISWSTPSLGANYRAAHLVDGRMDTQWYSRAGGFPQEIVISLPGEKAHTLSEVRLIGAGVEPKERLPRDFELLISATEQGGWMPVGSGTYFMRDADKSMRFAPVRARRVMLRIYSHWGDTQAVGLSGIDIPN